MAIEEGLWQNKGVISKQIILNNTFQGSKSCTKDKTSSTVFHTGPQPDLHLKCPPKKIQLGGCSLTALLCKISSQIFMELLETR